MIILIKRYERPAAGVVRSFGIVDDVRKTAVIQSLDLQKHEGRFPDRDGVIVADVLNKKVNEDRVRDDNNSGISWKSF